MVAVLARELAQALAPCPKQDEEGRAVVDGVGIFQRFAVDAWDTETVLLQHRLRVGSP